MSALNPGTLNPGKFNQRLVLEAPVDVSDGAGGVTRSFFAVRTLWASVEALSPSVASEGERLGANVTHRIVLRAGIEITTRHRLREGARVFDIDGLRDLPNRLIEVRAALRLD